jgi:hypothetical protein
VEVDWQVKVLVGKRGYKPASKERESNKMGYNTSNHITVNITTTFWKIKSKFYIIISG